MSMMATEKSNDFVLTHYLSLTAQRGTSLNQSIDQVPFILGLRSSPQGLRALGAILAAINWTTRTVENSGSLTVNVADVIIFSGHSTTITLPTASAGRVLVVKDTSGSTSTSGQEITINRKGTDTIDGSNTSIVLGTNYGAVMLVGDVDNSRWHAIAII